MRSSIDFYISTFQTIKKEYGLCQRIANPEERSSKLGIILTALKETSKNCYVFEMEEYYLHIIYTALCVSDTPLPEEHKMDLNQLLFRYKALKESPGYTALKRNDALKQKIDRYISTLEKKIAETSESPASLLR